MCGIHNPIPDCVALIVHRSRRSQVRPFSSTSTTTGSLVSRHQSGRVSRRLDETNRKSSTVIPDRRLTSMRDIRFCWRNKYWRVNLDELFLKSGTSSNKFIPTFNKISVSSGWRSSALISRMLQFARLTEMRVEPACLKRGMEPNGLFTAAKFPSWPKCPSEMVRIKLFPTEREVRVAPKFGNDGKSLR